jgi:hypothetical protein
VICDDAGAADMLNQLGFRATLQSADA